MNLENLEVEYCLYCLKPAKIYGGHILLDGIMITAGFCEKCLPVADKHKGFANKAGCYGGWIPEYGLKLDSLYEEEDNDGI